LELRRSLAVLTAVVVLGAAGCGGASRLSAVDRSAWDAGVLNVAVCAGQGFRGTVSYTGYRCRRSAAADTHFLLTSTIDKWGLSSTLRASLLKRAANQVQTACSECAAILGRAESQSSGWGGVSPFVWIYVFWCLIGGILGAVIARSKNRKTWEGALLGVLLGLIGVLIVALLPKVSDTPPPASPAPSATTRPTILDGENPLELARARYARGEITREEFEEITAALGHPGWSPRV
jgi:hypothetical protein